MKYLFYDLEKATSKNCGKICEFGYVVTDEKFNVLERNNFIINPSIEDKDWDWYAVKKIITRKVSEYESNLTFNKYYPKIKELIKTADYVVGHSLDGDAKSINDECKRYALPSLNYDFFDIKYIYKALTDQKECAGLSKILAELNVEGEDNAHDAEADAYNTMLALKTMLNHYKTDFETVLTKHPEIKDRTENYLINSVEARRIKKEESARRWRARNRVEKNENKE